jgi:hypothetical protein
MCVQPFAASQASVVQGFPSSHAPHAEQVDAPAEAA